MFKELYLYYFNNNDTPSVTFKMNFWFFINIRIFKLKVSNILNYFILGLNNLNVKKLSIFYKNLNFEFIFLYSIYIIIFIIILLFL